MPCDVLADAYDDTVSHLMTDLSPFGAWIDTIYPLDPGSELLVSLTPPHATDGAQDVVLSGRVARASLGRRRAEGRRSGMGVAFSASERERAQLTAALRGVPPPLPVSQARGSKVESAMIWVDIPVTYEEQHDDRTSVFTLIESVACYVDDADALLDLDPQSLVAAAPLLTGGYRGPRWRIALVS